MYRGIIQHKAFLTPYLAGEIMKRDLETPLSCGRIYRVVKDGASAAAPAFDHNPDSLVSDLGSRNAWLRHSAHALIVDKHLTALVPGLRKMMYSGPVLTGRIQALWVLEGLHQLRTQDLGALLRTAPMRLTQQVMAAAISLMGSRTDAVYWLQGHGGWLDSADRAAAPYAAYLAGKALQYDPVDARRMLIHTARKFPGDQMVSDAVISALKDQETAFLALYEKQAKDTTDAFVTRLKSVIQHAKQMEIAAAAHKRMNRFQLAGMRLFENNCQVCHGVDGAGIRGLGAPLNGSDWVLGDSDVLVTIVLKGLSGPVKVSGKLLAPPEVGGEMPAMANNDQLNDKEIAQIISYVRSAWNNRGTSVTPEEVNKIRRKYQDREQSFTMKELETLH